MCRQDIPDDYLDSSQVLTEALEDVKGENEGSNNQEWSWFYEGRNGWWRFEERNNEEKKKGSKYPRAGKACQAKTNSSENGQKR